MTGSSGPAAGAALRGWVSHLRPGGGGGGDSAAAPGATATQRPQQWDEEGGTGGKGAVDQSQQQKPRQRHSSGAGSKGWGAGGGASSNGGASSDAFGDDAKPLKPSGGSGGAPQGSLWSPEIASAMGYGKRGRAGSAFQWWVLVLSALLAIASYIAWAVLVFRARDTTEAALTALRVTSDSWATLKGVLLAAAIAFPILVIAAVVVSLWRARLASALNIHAPDAAWMRSSKAYQYANVISSCLLYLLFVLLLFAIGAMFVWASTARTAHIGSYYAIKYVDPIWNGTASVVDASQNLVRNFVGLTAALPGVGRRLQGEDLGGDGTRHDAADVLIIGGRVLTAADVEELPPHVKEAGLAAARSLQQLPGLFNNLGGWLAGAASAINSAPMPRINTDSLGNLPFLPQLLPNGSSNPLFNTLRTVTDVVQTQLLNSTGCPIYCIDLRNQSWIQDGCLCNLERVKAAYPHVSHVYDQAIPAIITLFLMTIGATWLLLHAASQWGRTRAEAKLLGRIPHAAKHALALGQQHSQAQQQGPAGGSGLGKTAGSSSSSGGGGGAGAAGVVPPSAPVVVAGGSGVFAAADVPPKQQPAPLASV